MSLTVTATGYCLVVVMAVLLAFVAILVVLALGFFAVLNRRSFKLTASPLKVLQLSVEIDKPDKPELPPGDSEP